MLLGGIYLAVALASALVGVLAVRSPGLGLAGIAVFGALGCYCALTAAASRPSDVVPTVVGTVAAGVVMMVLLRLRDAAPDPVAAAGAATPRRRFLAGGATAAGLAVVSGFGGRAAQHARFDVAAARARVVLPSPADSGRSSAGPAPGPSDLGRSGVPWATPNTDFYRVDTVLSVPQIDPSTWTLAIHGMVERPITLRYQDLLAMPLVERWITLCCVSNEVGGTLIGNARFLGARLADILRMVGVHPDADQLVLSSADGMTIGTPTAVVTDGRDALLAVGMNGVPLPVEHGFPVRVVVPGLYGYVSACKWVVDIEATTYARQQAFWVKGGWAARTDIKLESRIDTPRSGAVVPVGKPVAIAGVAWDQHVGVSAVEVQIDGGQWLPARLAAVPSADTWRQWVVPWTPSTTGSHSLRVRATDAAGTPQTETAVGSYPSGATGLHAITVRAL